jgi:enoyl-CoA hydratase/carnithine racemase
MSVEDMLLYDVKQNVATITINRPEKAHAFNLELTKGLYNNLLKADKDENVKCILLKSIGNEKIFSAGYDLSIIDDTNKKAGLIKFGRMVNEKMLLMKKPIVSQVHGTAVGFGFMLILASDLRIFADKPIEKMFFRMPEIAISAYPQTGATILPLLAFGLSYAKNILFTADRIGLEDLKNINFPTRVFPADELELETKKFLKVLTKHLTTFLFLMKSSITLMNKKLIENYFDLEDDCGKIAYEKKTHAEIEAYIKDLNKKYT